MSVLDRIATAIRRVIDREGPAGVREPRRPAPHGPDYWARLETLERAADQENET